MSREPANRADGALHDAMKIEQAYIAKRRELSDIGPRRELFGLALSGGGIRSATFSLGILQALSRAKLIRQLDYLSTVSGGSYIGSFFGALYVEPRLRGVSEPELDKDARAAFIERPLQSERGRKATARLREFGRYLTPGGFSDTIYGMSLMARNWVALQVVLGLAPLLFFLTLAILQKPKLWGWVPEIDPRISETIVLVAKIPVSWPLVAMVTVSALVSAGLATGFWFSRREKVSPSLIERVATNALVISALAVVAVLGWLIYPRLQDALSSCPRVAGPVLGSNPDTSTQTAASGPGTCLNPGSVLAEFPLIAVAAILVFAVGAYLLFAWGSGSAVDANGERISPEEAEECVRSRMTRALASSNFLLVVLLAMIAIDLLGVSVAAAVGKFSDSLRWMNERLGRQDIYAAIRVGFRHFWPFLVVIAPALLTVWAHASLRRGAGPGWLSRPAGQGALGGSILFLWLVIWAATARNIAPDALLWVWLGVALAMLVVMFCYGFLNLSSLVSLYALRLKRAYVGASNPDCDVQGFDIERRGDHISIEAYYSDLVEAEVAASPCADDPAAATPEQPAPSDPVRPPPPLNHLRPVHLINVTIAQTEPEGASHVIAYDRKGKPMHVSPAGIVHQQGGVGLSQVRAFDSAEPLTLSSWTAISGAAASTAIGSLTSLGLSILAMMANVRLGYWWKTDPAKGVVPNSISDTVLGYLWAELRAAFATDTDKRRWYLSDGGHFENTGAYALIQRRLDFIVVCDNGADPDYRLDDIVRLIDRARTDLNAEIEFYQRKELDEIFVLDGVLRAAFGEYRELARPAVEGSDGPFPYAALARIRYDIDRDRVDGAPPGTLLLIKPRLNFSEPPELLAYRRREQKFPQQTTLDQFFDEEQWEAYRRFGEVVGDCIFAPGAKGWSPRSYLEKVQRSPAEWLGAGT